MIRASRTRCSTSGSREQDCILGTSCEPLDEPDRWFPTLQACFDDEARDAACAADCESALFVCGGESEPCSAFEAP